MSFERELSVIDEVHVFKIPPRSSSEGYRAENWFENEIWSGRVRVVEIDGDCYIRLESKQGKLFAKSKVGPNSVERVIDSSRYFVLKIQRGTKHAFIGIGFSQRSEAFDFKDALDRFEKFKDNEKIAQQLSSLPTQDYSMKSGEKIKVNFKVKTNEKVFENSKTTGTKKKRKVNLSFDAPPESSTRRNRRRRKKGKTETTTQSSNSNNDLLSFM